MPRLSDITLSNHKSLKDVMFPVEFGTSKARFGTDFGSQISHVVYNPETNKSIAFHPSTYRFESNQEFMNPVIELLQKEFGKKNLEFDVKSFDDRQFYVNVNVKSIIHEIMKDDIVCPMVSFRNSYDGRVKQAISLSYYRQVCSNGLMGFSRQYTLEAKHNQGETINGASKKIIADIQKSADRMREFKRLKERRILPDEVEEMIKMVKETPSLKFPLRNISEVATIAAKEAETLDCELNAWLLYNAFNNVLNHSKSRLFPHEKEVIDKKMLRYVSAFTN